MKWADYQVIAWNLGWIVLAISWLGPLSYWATGSFAAHMLLHMSVVAVAAPLLSLGVSGRRWDPVRYATPFFSPIVASVGELIVVWAWHAPRLHHFARFETLGFVLEQISFVLAGLWIWLAAFGGQPDRRRCGAGVIGLLLTSMHMTLLGALLALSPRVLYRHGVAFGGLTPIEDQHLGGAIMLLMGGIAFLSGGLALTGRLAGIYGEPAAARPPRANDDSAAWNSINNIMRGLW